ncbi:MAG: class I SAM-dependent methyltransferase [Actinomycetota bacterium]
MKESQDAYGQAMLDHLQGREAWEIVERDDGYVSLGAGPKLYFAEFRNWRPVERKAMRFVRGRVLDIGCGAGRVLLHLQGRGMEVVGIDNSPAAIRTCRLRGAKAAKVMSVGQIGPRLGTFDTILMLGGNLGLFGTPERARRILSRLHRVTTTKGRIIGASRDRTKDQDPEMRRYVQRNRRLGRLSGQSRIRIRYRHHVTPWFDYFRITPGELAELLDGTGWQLSRILDSENDLYVAVIEKQRSDGKRKPHTSGLER